MVIPKHTELLTLLADYINGYKSRLPVNADTASLVKLAKQHQCSSIIYSQTDIEELSCAAASEIHFGVKRRAQLERIHKAFAAAKLDYLIFKGSEIAQYYPQPALRTMGDSDILVRPEDKKRAGEILLSLGLTNDSRGENEWGYHWNGIYYELHSRLMSDEAGNLPAHKAFMAEHWKYATLLTDTQYRLDESYHFVFVLLHLRKHFINSGVGFRQFMDVAVMQQKCNLKWDWIETKLTELDIAGFAKTCFALIERWFGISFPISAELDDDFYDEATEAVIHNGVFGFDNEKNKENYLKLQLQKDKHFKLKNVISTLFPSYDELRCVPSYEFLDGKPFLLPATWVYRFFYKLFGKNARSALNAVTKPFAVSENEVSDRIDMLHKWGINEF